MIQFSKIVDRHVGETRFLEHPGMTHSDGDA
jgi:hypothetical protein